MTKIKFPSYYTLLLYFILSILALTLFYISNVKHFDHDEFEHVHTTWYLAQQKLPYQDFYQHHHPLLWYTLLPAYYIFGDSSQTLIASRTLLWLATLGIALVSFLIAQKLSRSKNVGLLTAILVLANVFLIDKSLEIRPDVPQVLFGLASIYFLISYLGKQNIKSLILAALSLSISFLFLQKSIFLIAPYGLVLLFLWFKKKINFKKLSILGFVFLIPQLLFLAYLFIFKLWADYYLTNWLMNIGRNDSFSPFWILNSQLGLLFFSFSTLSALALISIKKIELEIKITAFLTLTILGSILMVNYPYLQYFMLSIPLLTICLVVFANFIVTKFKLKLKRVSFLVLLLILGAAYYNYTYWPITRIFSLIFLLLTSGFLILTSLSKINFNQFATMVFLSIFLAPTYFYFQNIKIRDTNFLQREIIDLVINSSDPKDLIHDSNINFNLFRPDLHYFWYSIGKNRGLGAYNKITNNKYGDYDACQMIKDKQPKLVSDFGYRSHSCDLPNYQKIIGRDKYEDAIFIRKD